MTKLDLVQRLLSLGDLTRLDAEVVVDVMFETIVSAIRAEDKVEIRGFGSFRSRKRKPRIGRNPLTGARVDVPAKRVAFFKPGKKLREAGNGSSGKTEAD